MQKRVDMIFKLIDNAQIILTLRAHEYRSKYATNTTKIIH